MYRLGKKDMTYTKRKVINFFTLSYQGLSLRAGSTIENYLPSLTFSLLSLFREFISMQLKRPTKQNERNNNEKQKNA